MRNRTAGTLVLALRAILASLSLAAILAACSNSPSPCESAGTCYQPPPTTFYSQSYYMSRGGFVYGGGGKSH